MGDGTNRNQPCGCGSGRKFKRCHGKQKPRSIYLDLDFGDPPRPIDSYQLTPTGGVKFFFEGQEVKPVRATASRAYDRAKAPKVLTKVDVPPDALNADANYALCRFYRLAGVDTNTRLIGSNKVSVAAVALGEVKSVSATQTEAEWSVQLAFEFWNSSLPPENVAWRKVVEGLRKHPEHDAALLIGIVVDSDMSNLTAYNKREKPICGDFFLPPGFELVYATTDSAHDNLASAFLSRCDRYADLIFDVIPTCGVKGLLTTPGHPFTHFRHWPGETVPTSPR